MKSHLLLFLILLTFFSCQTNGQENTNTSSATENKISNRRKLLGQISNDNPINIVYPTDNQELTKKYKKVIQLIQQQSRRWFKFNEIDPNSLTENDLKEKIFLLIGTPFSNSTLQKFKGQLPFDWTENALIFDEKSYSDSSSLLKLPLYPNPMNPKLPLLLMTGLNDDAIINYLQNLYENNGRFLGWSSNGYEFFQNGERLIYGNFNDETWEMDKKIHFDFTVSRDSMPSTPHFNFTQRTELNDAQATSFRQKCEQKVAKIRSFLETEKEIPPVQYCLYGSAEEKGLILNNTDQSHVDFSKNSVHTVLNDIYADNFIGKENQLLLRHFLGQPKTLALERGFAVFFTEKWQRKGYETWAKQLFDSGNILPLKDILTEEQGSTSRYLNGCLSGSFVSFLIQKHGKKAFLENYLTFEFSEKKMIQFEKEWHQYLKKQPAISSSDFTDKIPYLKGFNFAHEGYRIYNGYISREANKALDKMVDLGSNASCIVPYTFMRNPQKITQIPISDNAGSENDESIVHAARQSHQRGMTAVLKPQIWIGRGSWPGDVEMATDAEWDLWFQEYYEWILHYAMLAEIHEIEVLCVGTEFVKATLQRPEDWRKLIRKIRSFYSGKLTYAANWGDEFEKFTLWDEFDYIGINCYYPLSKNENASDNELKKGFQTILGTIERVAKKENKPVLFTEIGFRSIHAPWTEPHAEPNTTFNEEHQRRCYEIVFEAIENKDWCKGILWWKFPSYLGYRGRENSGFSPNQKVTEKVIEKWFGVRK